MTHQITPSIPPPLKQSAPACPVCLGMGFVRRDVPHGHPLFGKALKCACRDAEARAKLSALTYTWTGADDAGLALYGFESFNPGLQIWDDADGTQHDLSARYAASLAFARGYADRVRAGERVENVLLAGDCGTGKTHLACAVLNAARDAGRAGLYCTVPDLFNAVYASNFNDRYVRLASTTPLLVLDEIDKYYAKAQSPSDDEDAPRQTTYQKSTLGMIFKARYVAGLPTLLISNERHDLSPWLDEWTLSRFLGRHVTLDMTGRDCRQRGGTL